jgi:hypothetical protein
MKKILTVFAVIIVTAAALSWFAHLVRGKIKNVPMAGGAPEDFVLGVRSSVTYRLTDFLGKRVIVLAFLDNSANSNKFEQGCAGSLGGLLGNRHDLIWFNIKRENMHAVIKEQTKTLSLMYRAPLSDIPGFYGFSTLPSVLVIDRTGTIKLVYSGYSPTIFSDIRDSLPKTAK